MAFFGLEAAITKRAARHESVLLLTSLRPPFRSNIGNHVNFEPTRCFYPIGYLQARSGKFMEIRQEDNIIQVNAEETYRGTNWPETFQILKLNTAYKQILSGLSALLIFSVIVLLPHILAFYQITFIEDEISSNSNEVEQTIDPSCDIGHEDYDEEECVEIFRNGMILNTSITVIFYSVPVFGLAQIYLGVKLLMVLKTPDFENNINNDFAQNPEESDNTPPSNSGKPDEFYSQIGKLIVAFSLLIGSAIIYLGMI